MNFVSNVLLPHVTQGRVGRQLLAAAASGNSTSYDDHGGDHEAHLVFEYEELLGVLAFLACTWLLGWFSRRLGFPELVGNVLVGVLLGPELGNICGQFTLAMMLVGEVGFLLMMLEGGLEVDVPMLLQLGHRGFGVAIVGQGTSILTTIGMMMIFGLSAKSAFSAGAVFAPMSTSVLLAVFKQFELLNTPTGQLCLVAAVFDDCYGLILLSELKAVKEGGLQNILVPLVTSLGWLAIVGFFAIKYFPNLLNKYVMPHVPKKNRKGFLLGLCFSIAVGLASALYYTYASRYLGVFLAGLFFCTSPALQHDIWTAQVKKIHRWLLRIFFAATVGFEIPIKQFWTKRVWTKAAALFVPFVAKGVVGIFGPAPLKEEFWKVGIAMMSRGEMSFVINRMARAELGLIDAETGAAIMLVVVMAIFVVPLVLSMVLRFFARRRERELNERAKNRDPNSLGSSYYRLVVRTPHTFGMEYEEDYTILEAYLLETDAHMDTAELREKRLADLRDSVRVLMGHDRDSVEGTDLIKRMMDERAAEAGTKESVLDTIVQDDIFERVGRGVMVAQWAPWLDQGFLMRHTYHPTAMLDINETARPSEIYRVSNDPARRSANTLKRASKTAVHTAHPKEINAADVLRLARNSLAQSRAFRTSYVPGANAGSSRDSSYKGGNQFSSYMNAGGDGSGHPTETPRKPGPKFERVSMHLQHAHTFNNGGHEDAHGNGHAHSHSADMGPDDDEIMQRLVAVGIIPAPPSPVPPEKSESSVAKGLRLIRKSLTAPAGGLPEVPEHHDEEVPQLQPAPSTGFGGLFRKSLAPQARSGKDVEPESGGHFLPQSPNAQLIIDAHREGSRSGAAMSAREPSKSKTGVPPPPATPRTRFAEEAEKKK